MGQHGVIKDIAGGKADLVNILKVIDNVNGYDELDENDSAIPELEGNIAWTKLGQQLIKPLKQKIDEEKKEEELLLPRRLLQNNKRVLWHHHNHPRLLII